MTKIALNFLYIKEKDICPAYVSKTNINCEKQTILLMIPSEEKEGLHYLVVKRLSVVLRGITSKQHDDFYCLNCLHFIKQKINFNLMKMYVKLNIFVEL